MLRFTPTIPVMGRQRQEDHEFKANLGYKESSGEASNMS